MNTARKFSSLREEFERRQQIIDAFLPMHTANPDRRILSAAPPRIRSA
jgi:hypothetical protein